MNPKEITIFTLGDSQDASTWSNIPYYLSNTLQKKNYKVNCINVAGNSVLQKLYDKFICRLLRHIFLRGTSFTYERSYLYSLELKYRLKKAVEKYRNTDLYISTSFSYSPSAYTERPCILLCDWTYEYYISHFLKKTPDFLERKGIKRQDKVIESASMVDVLFPDIAAYMMEYYRNPNICYLGNVINSDSFDENLFVLPQKQRDIRILFIGLPKYMAGALSLVQAALLLQKEYPSITLNIIGMNREDFYPMDLPAFVQCHGYLHKNISTEKKLYDSLLNHATVYVNTTPEWAGFSSALEALYHNVPVITSYYQSFIDTFGDTIDFGYYCYKNEAAEIHRLISQLLNLAPDDYLSMCHSAHLAVLDFTWSSYVDHLIEKAKEL